VSFAYQLTEMCVLMYIHAYIQRPAVFKSFLMPRLSLQLSLRLSLKAGARPQAWAQSGMIRFTQLTRSLISRGWTAQLHCAVIRLLESLPPSPVPRSVADWEAAVA